MVHATSALVAAFAAVSAFDCIVGSAPMPQCYGWVCRHTMTLCVCFSFVLTALWRSFLQGRRRGQGQGVGMREFWDEGNHCKDQVSSWQPISVSGVWWIEVSKRLWQASSDEAEESILREIQMQTTFGSFNFLSWGRGCDEADLSEEECLSL